MLLNYMDRQISCRTHAFVRYDEKNLFSLPFTQKFNDFESRDNKTILYKRYSHLKARELRDAKLLSEIFREENKTGMRVTSPDSGTVKLAQRRTYAHCSFTTGAREIPAHLTPHPRYRHRQARSYECLFHLQPVDIAHSTCSNTKV